MKVIKSGKETKNITCQCEAYLEYDSDDIQSVMSGDYLYRKFIVCPECDRSITLYQNDVDEDGEKIITIENLVFPDDFFDNANAKAVDDERVNIWIKEGLSKLEADEKEYGTFRFTYSGDTLMLAVKYEDEYLIFVAKDIYETSIDR